MLLAAAVPGFVVPLVIVVVAILVVIIAFKAMWRVPDPNKAMIISGLRDRGPKGTAESMGFRIVTGKGAFVIPGVQAVRYLGLNLHEASLEVHCVSSQSIPVIVRGSVIYKVADDFPSIANAARRFLGQEERMDQQVHSIFAGHLRSIIGNMTVEELIGNRVKLEDETRKSSGDEMGKLGFILDSLKIQEIDDPTHYIDNLAKPHIAEVERAARISQATNNQTAASQEAESNAQVAEAQRDSRIRQADAEAAVNKASATAAQAGPLAEAQARQEVVQQETEIATLEAAKRERMLDSEIRRPAEAQRDEQIARAQGERESKILAAQAEAERVKLAAAANAEATTVTAEAQATQTRTVGEAEGAAIAARGKAEGDALKARAEGLSANQEAVIAQQLADRIPEIVAAAAGMWNNVDTITVLDGSEGVGKAFTSLLTTALSSLDTVREGLSKTPGHQNGHTQLDHTESQQTR